MKYANLELGTVEAVINKLGGIEGMQKFLSDELALKALKLLHRITTVSLPAVPRFVASEFFTMENPSVKFWDFDSNFRKNFLGRIEEKTPAIELAVNRLERASLDAPILAELGDRAETVLACPAGLLEKQPNGEDGVLLTNSYANVFYIGGRAVRARWSTDGGWCVGALPVDSPGKWFVGCRFFSRK